MPLFRRAFRRFDDEASKGKKKRKQRKRSGVLSKSSKPLVAFEDSSGVSPKNSFSRWEEVKQEEEECFGILQASTKENNDTCGLIVESQVNKGMHNDENSIWKHFENNPHQFYKKKENKGNAKSKSTLPDSFNERKVRKVKPLVDGERKEKQSMLAQENVRDDAKSYEADGKHIMKLPSKSAVVGHTIEQQPSEFGDPSKEPGGPFEAETSFEAEDLLMRCMDNDSIDPMEKKPMTMEKIEKDAQTVELTYSQSSSESDTGEAHDGDENQTRGMKVETEKELSVDAPPPEVVDSVVHVATELDSNHACEISADTLSDTNPGASVSGYVSLNHMHKTTHSDRSLESSMRQTGSEEETEEAKWRAKSTMATPLGATNQEIDALNRFLSVVGPDFNGRSVSFANRKEIYDNARKVGLNKVMVNKFLDQSAGITTVELTSTLSDLSACSTYSTSTASLRLAKSASSDQTSVTGYTKDTENISYYNLPRTSPHTDVNYGCSDTFKKYFWIESKKAGQDILESLGAVVIGDNESVHLEA